MSTHTIPPSTQIENQSDPRVDTQSAPPERSSYVHSRGGTRIPPPAIHTFAGHTPYLVHADTSITSLNRPLPALPDTPSVFSVSELRRQSHTSNQGYTNLAGEQLTYSEHYRDIVWKTAEEYNDYVERVRAFLLDIGYSANPRSPAAAIRLLRDTLIAYRNGQLEPAVNARLNLANRDIQLEMLDSEAEDVEVPQPPSGQPVQPTPDPRFTSNRHPFYAMDRSYGGTNSQSGVIPYTPTPVSQNQIQSLAQQTLGLDAARQANANIYINTPNLGRQWSTWDHVTNRLNQQNAPSPYNQSQQQHPIHERPANPSLPTSASYDSQAAPATEQRRESLPPIKEEETSLAMPTPRAQIEDVASNTSWDDIYAPREDDGGPWSRSQNRTYAETVTDEEDQSVRTHQYAQSEPEYRDRNRTPAQVTFASIAPVAQPSGTTLPSSTTQQREPYPFNPFDYEWNEYKVPDHPNHDYFDAAGNPLPPMPLPPPGTAFVPPPGFAPPPGAIYVPPLRGQGIPYFGYEIPQYNPKGPSRPNFGSAPPPTYFTGPARPETQPRPQYYYYPANDPRFATENPWGPQYTAHGAQFSSASQARNTEQQQQGNGPPPPIPGGKPDVRRRTVPPQPDPPIFPQHDNVPSHPPPPARDWGNSGGPPPPPPPPGGSGNGGGPPPPPPPGPYGSNNPPDPNANQPGWHNLPAPSNAQGNHYYYVYPSAQRDSSPRDTSNEEEKTALQRESRLNTRNPDSFSGLVRSKWRPFVTECLIMFNSKPVTYNTDSSKIQFAASYFTDAAQSHYSMLLQLPITPDALLSWSAFVIEFSTRFGIYDQAVDAQTRLERLNMLDKNEFSKFLVRWEEAASLTGWNDAALQYNLYKAIAPRLRTAMKDTPMPDTLAGLQQFLLLLDQRYWHWYNMEQTISGRTTVSTSNTNRAATNGPRTGPNNAAPNRERTWNNNPRPAANANNPGTTQPQRPGPPANARPVNNRNNAVGRATFTLDGDNDDISTEYEVTDDPEPPTDETEDNAGNEDATQELPGGY